MCIEVLYFPTNPWEGVGVSFSTREEVEIPDGVEVRLEGKVLEMRGPKGRLVRVFDMPGVRLGVEGKKIFVESPSSRRRLRAAVGTARAHLLNMIKGVVEGFTYRLRVVYSHFPITVKTEGGRVLIYNFLGERAPRVAKIVGDTKVEVRGDEIIVEGIDKEEAGQTAWNIRQATLIKGRDLRVFQDGIYCVE